jgi:lipopolysaccharide/colanic/teichoic acid biosynthesis glycosyltransferase
MLLLMWLAGCSLVAVTSAALARADGPWLLGFAAIMAAQVVVLAGRATRLPARVTWPLAVACLSPCAFAYDAGDVAILIGLAAVLMLVVDRFAALSVGLSAFFVTEGAAGSRTLRSSTLAPPDPIARDFARVRREEQHLTVASIAPAAGRTPARRLSRTARELVPCLRLTDAVVRVTDGRLLVVLPGADHRVAVTVLGRVPAPARDSLLLGIATFPEDGQTFGLLKELARSREAPWTPGDDSGPDPRPRERPQPETARVAADGPAVLIEARAPGTHLRRAADLLALALMAPIVVPLVLVLAIAVKLDSPGPAFVRIKRLGRDGQPFDLFKLRSMTRDAERLKETLKHMNTLAWPDFKIAEDPRVTRVGRLLRKYSLDELPQLHNILRGEMTFVGPRPCSVKVADYDLWQSERLDATPGLVGQWQAEGRGRVDFAERCRLDIRQSRSRSIRVNLQLVLATIRSVFVSKGAY